MTPDELRALIVQAAQESATRSGSAYVDVRQALIQQKVAELASYAAPFADAALSEDEVEALAALQPEIDALAADLAQTIGAGMLRVAAIVRGRAEYKALTGLTITNTPTAGVLPSETWALSFEPTLIGAGRDPSMIPVWSSGTPGVATIDATTGLVTTVAAGSTVITCTVNGHSATYTFVVVDTPAVADSVVVTQGLTTGPITVPESSPDLQLAAQTKDQFGENFTDTHTWETSNASFATVDAAGLVNVVAAGTVTITARSVANNTITGTFQIVVTATVLTPTTLEISGPATRSTTVGAGGTMTAIVKDQNGDTMPGLEAAVTWASDNADVAINASSGAWTADGEGGATVTATYAGVDPDLTDTVAFTVGPAVSAGQRESPVGRPQYGWTAEQNYIWDQMRQNNHWWYLEHVANSNAGTIDLMGHHSAFLYQVEGLPLYLTRAWSRWLTVAEQPFTASPVVKNGVTYTGTAAWALSQMENTIRRYGSWLVQIYTWLYPGLTAEQRLRGCECLNEWKDGILRKVPLAPYTGGWTDSDSDAIAGITPFLWMLNYLDVPENKAGGGGFNNYLTLLSDGMHQQTSTGDGVLTKPMGGATVDGYIAEPTGANWTTMRNAFYQVVTRGAAGGSWHEGSQYNAFTISIMCCGILNLRTSGNNGSPYGGAHDLSGAIPEFDAWLEAYAEKYWAQLTPACENIDVWSDANDPPRTIDKPNEWQALAYLAGGAATYNATYKGRIQKRANDFATAHQSALSSGTSHHTHGRAILFFNPYATADAALPHASAMSWTFLGDDTNKMYGIGNLIGMDATRQLSLRGGNMHYTDHGYQTWCSTQLWRDNLYLLTMPNGYSTSLWKAACTNSVSLCGLGSMNYHRAVTDADGLATTGRGVLRHLNGVVSTRPWGSLHCETHGPYYRRYDLSKESYEQRFIEETYTFVNKAERRQTYINMPNDIDVLWLHDDFDVDTPANPSGTYYPLWKGLAVYTTFQNHFAKTGGCTKLLHWYAPTTPSYSTASGHPVYSWEVGAYTIELHCLYWGSGGTTVGDFGTSTDDAQTYTGVLGTASEYVGWKRINWWSNGAVTPEEKYSTVLIVRPTAQASPSLAMTGGDPDTLVIGGTRTFEQLLTTPFTTAA